MTDMASLIFYLAAFLSAAALMRFGLSSSRKFIIGLALAIPIVIGGLRYNVGTDYASYERLFESFLDTTFSDYLAVNTFNIEPGFFLLIKLCQLISDQPFILFIAAALLTVVFYYIGLKNIEAKHKSLIYLLYLTVIFPITFNATRQGIAISIAFLALTYLIKAKNKKFILFVLLASAFHLSAIIVIIAYPIFKFFLRKKEESAPQRFLLRAVVGFALAICLAPFIFHALTQISFFEKYATYADYVSGVSATMIIFKVSMILVATYFYRRLSSKNPYVRSYYLLALLEISTINLWFNSAALFRISLFFTPFTLILISELPNAFKTNRDKVIVQASLALFCVAYFYVAYFVAGQAEIIPYQFVNI